MKLNKIYQLKLWIIGMWVLELFTLWYFKTPIEYSILEATVFALIVMILLASLCDLWNSLNLEVQKKLSLSNNRYAARFMHFYLIEYDPYFEHPNVGGAALFEYNGIRYTVMTIGCHRMPASFKEHEFEALEKAFKHPLERIEFYEYCNQKLKL